VAVDEWVFSIQNIQNPTEKVQLTAVKQFVGSIQYIQNPTQRVIQLAKQKDQK
jgi:hypothetical protein